MRLSYAVDTDELSASEADELQKLVESADIAGLGERQSARRPRPDAFSYRLKIDNEDGSHTIVASDTDMSASLRQLITWLVKRATQSH